MSLTLQEAADRAGVHYMTVYRWVRTGRLPATKVGGAWAVEPEDLDGLAAAPPDAPQGRARRADHAGRLARRLMAGDDAGALSVAEAALTGGMDLEQLNVTALPEAMTEIGRAWAAGDIGVDAEHRATATTYRLLGRLAPRFARKGRRRGTIVLGAAPGEAHGLPVAMLADPLRGRGHEVVDLGADTPVTAFVDAATTVAGLIAVGISTTIPGTDGAVGSVIDGLRGAGIAAPILVGGAGCESVEAARALGADGWTRSGPEALTLLTRRP
jgi:MerR family transcriptional regulator, light-induced transcriptional regulator